MELLDNKHVQSLGGHLAKLIQGFADLHGNLLTLLNGPALFPVEVDLSNNAFQYKSTTPITTASFIIVLTQLKTNQSILQEPYEDEIENGVEVQDGVDVLETTDATTDEIPTTPSASLIPDLDDFVSKEEEEPDYNMMDNLTLLSTLNLRDVSPNSASSTSNSNSTEGNLLPDLIN